MSSRKRHSVPSSQQATGRKTITDPTLRGSPSSPSVQIVRNQPPVSTALQQCCHLIHLQDFLLQNALKHRKELIDTNRSEKYQYEELSKELEVKLA